MKRTYRLTKEQRSEIIRLYVAGIKIDSIAAEFGVGRSYPGRLARSRGVPRRGWTNNRPVVKYITTQESL